MTKPKPLTGKALFDTVNNSTEDAFWWLGQHSFILKIANKTLLIDPYLADVKKRNVPPLFHSTDATSVDLVLCTHDHSDHIDPVAVSGLAKDTNAQFIAPKAHEERMLSLGVPANRLTLINANEQTNFKDLTITAIKAAHEFFDETPEGHFPYLGYVIESPNKTIYHAGDTVWWEGLQALLKNWNHDLALVPINGRDAQRYKTGIIGNMTYQEAADLIGGLNVKLAVPTHYDMFDANLEDPQKFLDFVNVKYPQQQSWVGNVSEKVTF